MTIAQLRMASNALRDQVDRLARAAFHIDETIRLLEQLGAGEAPALAADVALAAPQGEAPIPPGPADALAGSQGTGRPNPTVRLMAAQEQSGYVRILQAVQAEPGAPPLATAELAGVSLSTVYTALSRAAKAKHVRRVRRGVYKVTPAGGRYLAERAEEGRALP
jgi:hypothetical protein